MCVVFLIPASVTGIYLTHLPTAQADSVIPEAFESPFRMVGI